MADLSTYLSAAAIAALPVNVTTKEASDWKFLQAVALVESGVHYNTIGDGGKALGAWQMHVGAWVDGNAWLKAHGRKTWNRSSWLNKKAQQDVAYGFLQITKERLEKANVEVNPENVYLVWSMGFSAFAKVGYDPLKCPREKLDAAARVENLFLE